MKAKRLHNNKLQRERLSRGWKQEKVAEELGVDVRTVRRWEGGYPVRPLNIAGLTRLFGKSADDLGLVEETDESPEVAAPPDEDPGISPLPGDLPASGLEYKDGTDSALPIQPTPLIGREQEIFLVKQLLCRPGVRLLTLTGPGGTGKTRLGVQVASELRDCFPDGVFFVSLASIREVALVSMAIAQALGIWEVSRQSLLESLKAYLQKKQVLLLLDNFEQVVRAADQVAELLAVCPLLKILVTSREMLHIRAEYEFFVPPLALPERFFSSIRPDLVTLSRNPAIELFVQRAQAIQPNFQVTVANVATVAKICIRLDGLPLAIELAAARSKLLAPQALLTRLESRLQFLTDGPRDLPFRQKTLRNTIAWSYDLLSPNEQGLFRRLSVFIGGFTLEAVVAFGALLGETSVSVLDRVDSLLDKSLLQLVKQSEGEEHRFLMLETIREYGLEALAAHGEMEESQHVHALTYLELAEQAEEELFGPQQSMWLERLDKESGNLRAAIQWWLEQPDPGGIEQALRMGGALQQFWEVRGYRSEGRKFLQQALTAQAEVAPAVRANALDAAIVLAVNQSDLDQAVELCQENLTLCRTHQNERGIALSLHRLAGIAWSRGKLLEAGKLYEGALKLFRNLGDKWGIASVIEGIAFVALDQGDYSRAHILLEESLALWRELGNECGLAYSLWLKASAIFYAEGGMRSLPEIEESLSLSKKLRYKYIVSYSLITYGFMFFFQGEIDRAQSIFEEALTLSREMGDRRSIALGLYAFGWIALSRGDYTTAYAYYEKSLAILRDLSHQWIIALSIEGLAMAAGSQGKRTRAVRLWGAAEALRETIGAPATPEKGLFYEPFKEALREQLGKSAFTSGLREGRDLTLDDILAIEKFGPDDLTSG